jgi:hypothetical protein
VRDPVDCTVLCFDLIAERTKQAENRLTALRTLVESFVLHQKPTLRRYQSQLWKSSIQLGIVHAIDLGDILLHLCGVFSVEKGESRNPGAYLIVYIRTSSKIFRRAFGIGFAECAFALEAISHSHLLCPSFKTPQDPSIIKSNLFTFGNRFVGVGEGKIAVKEYLAIWDA